MFTYVGDEMVFQGNFVIYRSAGDNDQREEEMNMRIAIDAMGGDHAPGLNCKGALAAAAEWPEYNSAGWQIPLSRWNRYLEWSRSRLM